jgi:hypothetical protein
VASGGDTASSGEIIAHVARPAAADDAGTVGPSVFRGPVKDAGRTRQAQSGQKARAAWASMCAWSGGGPLTGQSDGLRPSQCTKHLRFVSTRPVAGVAQRWRTCFGSRRGGSGGAGAPPSTSPRAVKVPTIVRLAIGARRGEWSCPGVWRARQMSGPPSQPTTCRSGAATSCWRASRGSSHEGRAKPARLAPRAKLSSAFAATARWQVASPSGPTAATKLNPQGEEVRIRG